jgi:hypothetical protein
VPQDNVALRSGDKEMSDKSLSQIPRELAEPLWVKLGLGARCPQWEKQHLAMIEAAIREAMQITLEAAQSRIAEIDYISGCGLCSKVNKLRDPRYVWEDCMAAIRSLKTAVASSLTEQDTK